MISRMGAYVFRGLMSMDPPEHTRLRKPIASAFTARRIGALRPRARQIAHDLVDGMVTAGKPVDLVDAFAYPLPVAVICELLGVPVEDRARFRVWSDATISTSRLVSSEIEASHQELHAYMSDLIAGCGSRPADT
jgi:cytochrome P450